MEVGSSGLGVVSGGHCGWRTRSWIGLSHYCEAVIYIRVIWRERRKDVTKRTKKLGVRDLLFVSTFVSFCYALESRDLDNKRLDLVVPFGPPNN